MTPADLAVLTAALQAFPPLVNVIQKLLEMLDKKQANTFMNELEDAIDGIQKAKTEGEKLHAAKQFVATIRSVHK